LARLLPDPTPFPYAARLELSLLDPQVARELGILAPNLLDEAVGNPPLRIVRADAATMLAPPLDVPEASTRPS